MENKKIIRHVLESNLYCNIATVCSDGLPWNTPVFFGYDEAFNMYWRSWTENTHSLNIAAKPQAFITVYDSNMAWGEGIGIYLRGKVVLLEDEKSIKHALSVIDRRSPRKFEPQDFMGNNPRRVYKFTPKNVWTNIDSKERGQFVDDREELELTK